MVDPYDRLAGLKAEFACRARPIVIRSKSSHWVHRWIDKFLRVVTLGGQDRYLHEYVTTFGHTIFVPEGFGQRDPTEAWEVLRHEAVHVQQFERWGWVGMVLVYGLFPLPLGLSWGRARLEWEAYKESLRARAEARGVASIRDPVLHAWLIRRFVGPDYGWMWPFPKVVQRWINEAIVEIERSLSSSG